MTAADEWSNSIVLGRGARLFPEGTPELPLELLESESFSNGVTHLAYTPAGGGR